jgi:septum formation inhibitor MinC
MGLESGTYIDSLNASNPATTDALSQADDHMRLIKSTIKATFPNITGEVTLTHTEINALETRVDDLEGTGTNAPAITYSGGTPALKTGITALEIRDLLGLGTSTFVEVGSLRAASVLSTGAMSASTHITAGTYVRADELRIGDWKLYEDSTSGRLEISHSGTVVAHITDTGTVVAEGNVTAYGAAGE